QRLTEAGARGFRAGLSEALFRRGVLDLRGNELARVPRRGPGLTDRALGIDAWRPREVEIRDAVFDVGRHAFEPRRRGGGQLALGAQAVEEEREHPVQAGVQVVVRLSLPHLERLVELAPTQD